MKYRPGIDRTTYRTVRTTVNTVVDSLRKNQPEFADPNLRQEALRTARAAAYIAAIAALQLEQTERRATKRLLELARTDPITGLDNRSGYEENIRDAFMLGKVQEIPVSVITLDLNNIDVVNETQGRAEGDRWIQTTASILRGSSPRRPSRWGGDEYGVILLGADEQEVRSWWAGISGQFNAANVHISAGAATYHPSPNKDDIEGAITWTHRAADEALYLAKVQAKELGTNVLLGIDEIHKNAATIGDLHD